MDLMIPSSQIHRSSQIIFDSFVITSNCKRIIIVNI